MPTEGELNQGLIQAAVNGDEFRVSELIRDGADPNFQSKTDGKTALFHACSENNVECVQALLAAKADPELEDTLGFRPLHWAAQKGDGLGVVRALLEGGADVDALNRKKQTALNMAAFKGLKDVVRTLVDIGKANLEAADGSKKGKRALHVATEKGDKELLKMLLAWNVDTSAKCSEGGHPHAQCLPSVASAVSVKMYQRLPGNTAVDLAKSTKYKHKGTKKSILELLVRCHKPSDC